MPQNPEIKWKNNFKVVKTPGLVYKIADERNPEMMVRMSHEIEGLRMAPQGVVPVTTETYIHGVGPAIKMEHIDGLGKQVTFLQLATLIESIQATRAEGRLPIMSNRYAYYDQAAHWLSNLHDAGDFRGLSN